MLPSATLIDNNIELEPKGNVIGEKTCQDSQYCFWTGDKNVFTYLFMIFGSYSVSEPILSQVPSSFVIDLGCAVSITLVRLRNSGSNLPNPARQGKICNEIKIMYSQQLQNVGRPDMEKRAEWPARGRAAVSPFPGGIVRSFRVYCLVHFSG